MTRKIAKLADDSQQQTCFVSRCSAFGSPDAGAIKIHRGNLMKKMGAKSLAELVRMAEVLGVRGEASRCS